jgi:hypothetical protein
VIAILSVVADDLRDVRDLGQPERQPCGFDQAAYARAEAMIPPPRTRVPA